jgi:outer membrane receptor protein involved in Fe transport
VYEGAVEFDLPLLRDKFMVKNLSFNGGFRYTNYSTSGSATTWKAGLDWSFTDSLTLRATRSKDIRAPTLFELYRPSEVGSFNGNDFWTNTTLNGSAVASDGKVYPTAATFARGNPDLKPETGNTTTAGIVYRPGWAPGLAIALDSFFIDLKDAITNVNGNSQAAQLGCANSGGTATLYCSLIVRPKGCCDSTPSNSATALYQQAFNLANRWTQGADLELNYTNRLFDRPYNLRLLTTYQPHIVEFNPLSGTSDSGGTFLGAPVWRASLTASFSPTENIRVSILERWRNRLDWVPKQSAPLPELQATMPPISAVFYTNLNVSYTMKNAGFGDVELFANVQNLFDREPPIARAYNDTQPGNFGVTPGDDPIGRYYILGFRYRK